MKSRMFKEMGEFAEGERSKELKAKYGPPEVEGVPGAEEDGGLGADELPAEGMPAEESTDIAQILEGLTPEQLADLEQMLLQG